MSCIRTFPANCFLICRIALAAPAFVGSAHAAATETVLYSFQGGTDGANPQAGLLLDKAGNLYGTTENGGDPNCNYGGQSGCGTVFKLAPNGTESVLYAFQGKADGALPVAGLIENRSGALYGTTYGGAGAGCGSLGCGTVFRLATDNTEKVLYAFTYLSDGGLPAAGVIANKDGVLYGTTLYGGNYICDVSSGCGVVFEVGPHGVETVVYSFSGGSDAAYPQAGLIADDAGSFYGTTENGGGGNCVTNGQQGCGAVYELTPQGAESVLYAFKGGTDGSFPLAGLLLDPNGNLYGTTSQGGAANAGIIFEISPGGTETILLSFDGGAGGANPHAPLIADRKGNLFGTTVGGGADNKGVVFRLSPSGKETVLHSFGASGDGAAPYAGLIADRKGNMYGTTSTGGTHGYGTIYEIANAAEP